MPGFLGSGGAADSLLSYPSGTQGPVEDSRTTRRLSETPFSKVASPHFTLSSCHSASHEPGSKKKLGPTVGFLLGVTISPWHDSETKRWSRKWGRAGCIHLNVYMWPLQHHPLFCRMEKDQAVLRGPCCFEGPTIQGTL